MVKTLTINIDTPASVLYTAVGKTHLYMQFDGALGIILGADNTISLSNGLQLPSGSLFEIDLEDGDVLWAHRLSSSAVNVHLLIKT